MTTVREPGRRNRRGVDAMLPCALCCFDTICYPESDPSGELSSLPLRRNLIAGQHLVYAGQVRRSLHVLRHGSLKAYELSRDGSERTCDVYLPGEPVGLDAFGVPYQTEYVVALEHSRYCEIPLAVIRRLMVEVPRIRDAIPVLIGTALNETRQRLPVLRHGSARSRLCTFILDLSDRRRRRGLDPVRFRLSMDRRDIASLLGVTLETVSRAMGQVQREGLIRVSGKHLSLLDRRGLALSAANECLEIS